MADLELADRLKEAHGILASIAWATVMPLGAVLLRVVPSSKAWLIHGAVMGFGLVLFTSAFGLGLRDLSIYHSPVSFSAHTIIGTVLFSFAWLQPFLGVAHHYILLSTNKRTLISAIHILFGRMLIILGMINGALGLILAEQSTRAENIIYGTLVGIIWVAYTLVTLGYEIKRDNQAQWALRRTGSTHDSERPTSIKQVHGGIMKSEML